MENQNALELATKIVSSGKRDLAVDILVAQKKVSFFGASALSALMENDAESAKTALKYMMSTFYKMDRQIMDLYDSTGIDLEDGKKKFIYEVKERVERKYGAV